MLLNRADRAHVCSHVIRRYSEILHPKLDQTLLNTDDKKISIFFGSISSRNILLSTTKVPETDVCMHIN